MFASIVVSTVLFGSAIRALSQSRPVLFINAAIIDGSGRASFRGDVKIKNGKIVKIGNIKPSKDDEIIDAKGLVLAPGFIDIHNHSESGLLRDGSAANQVSQGITTIMVGPDGGSPWTLSEYFSKLEGKIAVNVGAFIGHATVREEVLKNDYQRKATDEEIGAMVKLVDQAMREGAFGLSSGLEYDAGYMASIEELIALSRVAAKYDGIYMSHIRDEEEGFRAAMEEAIRIGREAKLPVQISHIKMGNRNVWGKSAEAIQLIETARNAGQDVTADAYPYTAWASTITVLVPSRKHEDRTEIETGLANVGGAEKVLITSHSANRSYEMKNMAEIAASKNISPVDLYIEIVKNGGAGVVCNSMSEDDVKAFYQRPWVMVSSDGGIGSRHPRGTGTFTRVLGRFVRDNKWLSLEEAIHKMSAMPASRLSLKDRGLIKKGMNADLVLFDASTVIDNATFAEPQTFSTGIRATFVNGTLVWDGAKVTGETPGSILRQK